MTKNNTFTTREEWLVALGGHLERLFEDAGYEVPAYRVSCGFPSTAATARKKRRIGECWDAERSDGKVYETFVSPLLDDAMEVAGVVAHEMVHAVVGLKASHGPKFKKCATAIGLEGKMTATVPGDRFKAWVGGILEALGPYPHQKLTLSSAPKKQVGRMLKMECPACRAAGEPYIVRGTATVAERGAPLCPIHCVELVVEGQVKEKKESDDAGSPA